MIEIIPYNGQYASVFKELNMKWLDQFGLTESHDLEMLDDPQGTIIDPGGFIFLAVDGDKLAGTAAIIKTGQTEFELVKMTVDENYRGRGISKILIEKCISQAIQSGAAHLHLVSNHQLKEAISLYEKYGFQHTPLKKGPYITADISMDLDLTSLPANK